ncbi:hypothetical protein ASPBRDRAFT_457597 [Aspergillus brasiliensis CBS 101740]|uniref:Uncharacterized protein n=1 Tax=Aspergillus brasiliensis (strain CBS 101740 / IMI 381727 / IBT 21946) TaxID=767769 RepID=A0A1L9USU7_ASPBC|nr:hypothetical protein ASPBRDRAFT_457597 [Aspergillus brasiliensis CBS 101740]
MICEPLFDGFHHFTLASDSCVLTLFFWFFRPYQSVPKVRLNQLIQSHSISFSLCPTRCNSALSLANPCRPALFPHPSFASPSLSLAQDNSFNPPLLFALPLSLSFLSILKKPNPPPLSPSTPPICFPPPFVVFPSPPFAPLLD